MQFSARNLCLVILGGVYLLSPAACSRWRGKEPPPAARPVVNEAKHPNGLAVGVPPGYAARRDENGFVIEPEGNHNAALRNPVKVYVSLLKSGTAAGPGGEDPDYQTKTVAGREVRYRIKKEEGGSGGEMYEFEARETVPGGRLEYRQGIQSEHAAPDFALCWSIIETTKFDAAPR